jgi:hypothetical protein
MDAFPKPLRALVDDRDMLTGLPGVDAACAWLDRAGQDGFAQAMLVGLHRFQSVNLAYGKAAGDRVLAEIARRIVISRARNWGRRASLRGWAAASSWWPPSPPAALAMAGRSAGAIDRAADPAGRRPVAACPRTALLRGQPGERGAPMLDRLDQALLSLQRGAGGASCGRMARTRCVAAAPRGWKRTLSARSTGRRYRAAVPAAVHRGRWPPDRRGALARWRHPELGLVGAETLFAIAERGDHISQLSHHIAERALAEAADWPDDLRLSLNVTAEDFAVGDLAAAMRALVAASGFPAERLTLEITEQTLIADFEACAETLRELAGMGMRVALDDFGTGFANFRTLRALPLDALKLDQSLVRDIAQDPRDRAILRAIVAMARA